MATPDDPTARIAAVAARQNGVVHRRQLLALGLTPSAIRHRVATGRLHRRRAGVYAVGRAELGREGEWAAAVLSCGPGAALSHISAAALWGIWPRERGEIDVSIPRERRRRPAGIRVHRPRRLASDERTTRRGIAVTTPIRTLVDLAGSGLEDEPLESAVNDAVRLGLTSVADVRRALDGYGRQPGAGAFRRLLDGFQLTDSALERLFLRVAAGAGLGRPLTRCRVNGYRVDFYWPKLRLVVETDGATFHRSAARQTRDRRRDQAHAAAGLVPLRFTHAQVRHQPRHVEEVLRRVARRLAAR